MKTSEKMVRFLKPLGAGITMGIMCLLTILTDNFLISQIGIFGVFAFLMLQRKSIQSNIKAMLVNGIVLMLGFMIGLLESSLIVLIPYTIAVFHFFCFSADKLYKIPKPKFFFAIMLFATGTNMNLSVTEVFTKGPYFLIGWGVAMLVGIIISLLMRLPWRAPDEVKDKKGLRQRYNEALDEDNSMLVKAAMYSFVLFVAAYTALLFHGYNGHWILISCGAVMLGEDPDTIIKRGYHKILGSVFGIIIGIFLMMLNLDVGTRMIILIISNILIEYFMSRNYAIANIFTTPQILVLLSLSEGRISMNNISQRFIGVLIGTFIALVLTKAIYHCINAATSRAGGSAS